METLEEALREIHPQELPNVWPVVLPGVQRLLRKCPDDFTPEEVYVFLKTGRATLLLLTGGFVIVQVETQVNGVRTLVVWQLFCPGAKQRRAAINRAIDGLARKVQCQRVQFKSPRRGWEREAIKEGYELKMIVMEKKL